MKKEDLRKMHVPKKFSGQWEQLQYLADHGRLREIEKRDEGSIGLTIVSIISRGGGFRETFQGYNVMKCHVGPVYDKFAEIWLDYDYESMESINRPVRFGIKAHHYLVLE